MGVYATYDAPNMLVILDQIAPTAGVLNIDSQIDLYSDAKEDWQSDPELMKYPFPFQDSFGGNVLSATQNAGDYYQLRNDVGWRVRPYEADHDLNISGNLYPVDPALPLMVPTVGGYTVLARIDTSSKAIVDTPAVFDVVLASTPVAGSYGELLQNMDLAIGLDGRVHISTANGSAAATGTLSDPVDSVFAALPIAAANNIDEIHVHEGVVVSATDDVSNYTFHGEHAGKSEIIVQVSAVTQFTQFFTCSLKGTMNGSIIVRDSLVEDVFNFKGIMHQTMINGGGFSLASSVVPSHILDCFSGKPGEDVPEINYNNADVELGIRNYNGGFKLTNKTVANDVSIDLNSGQGILDSTVVAGHIVMRGVGKAVDDMGNALETGAWNGTTLLVEMVESKFAKEAWKILGLDPNDPVVDTLTRRYVQSSAIVQVRSGDPDIQITQTRQ